MGAELYPRLLNTAGKFNSCLSLHDRKIAVQAALNEMWKKIESNSHRWSPGVGKGASLNLLFKILARRSSNVLRSLGRRRAHFRAIEPRMEATLTNPNDLEVENDDAPQMEAELRDEAGRLGDAGMVATGKIESFRGLEDLRAGKAKDVLAERKEMLRSIIRELGGKVYRVADIAYSSEIELTVEQIRQSYQTKYSELLAIEAAKSLKTRADKKITEAFRSRSSPPPHAT